MVGAGVGIFASGAQSTRSSRTAPTSARRSTRAFDAVADTGEAIGDAVGGAIGAVGGLFVSPPPTASEPASPYTGRPHVHPLLRTVPRVGYRPGAPAAAVVTLIGIGGAVVEPPTARRRGLHGVHRSRWRGLDRRPTVRCRSAHGDPRPPGADRQRRAVDVRRLRRAPSCRAGGRRPRPLAAGIGGVALARAAGSSGGLSSGAARPWRPWSGWCRAGGRVSPGGLHVTPTGSSTTASAPDGASHGRTSPASCRANPCRSSWTPGRRWCGSGRAPTRGAGRSAPARTCSALHPAPRVDERALGHLLVTCLVRPEQRAQLDAGVAGTGRRPARDRKRNELLG